MLKYIFYISFFGYFLVNPSISEIRELYKKSNTSNSAAQALFKKLEGVKNHHNVVLVGYKAASMALKAKSLDGAKNKKAYFKEAVVLLEEVISKKPNNIELRLIRLSIQENSPKLLKYKTKIPDDKSFILDNLKNEKDANLKTYIKSYVLQSKSFSTEEKKLISE